LVHLTCIFTHKFNKQVNVNSISKIVIKFGESRIKGLQQFMFEMYIYYFKNEFAKHYYRQIGK